MDGPSPLTLRMLPGCCRLLHKVFYVAVAPGDWGALIPRVQEWRGRLTFEHKPPNKQKVFRKWILFQSNGMGVEDFCRGL